MTTDRGAAVQQRLDRLNLSDRDFERRTGVERKTLRRAIDMGDRTRESTWRHIETQLDKLEAGLRRDLLSAGEVEHALDGVETEGKVTAPVAGEARGQALRTRRLRLGIKSVRQLAMQSGVSRVAVTAAEDGQASESTYLRLESWLGKFDEETGSSEIAEETAPQMVTIRGTRGHIDVVVSGPIGNLDALTETVERLLRAPNGGHHDK